MEDRWRRALADLDNLCKRHARELEREPAVERSRTADTSLPVLDNLELALTHAGADPGAIAEGIRAVRDQAMNVIDLLGYPRHAETGVAFDPARHEVVGVVQDPDAPPGTVVEVLRPGYRDGERQLRPAAVTVAKRE
ncbi:nucleotide exchange factor GrpE [Streptomyces sp. NPDC048489]|uniref:nucleotide exchange factor GrpE n=1 Tax=Streptomyces sp. NPDC048489 TaxID=3154504 RepID=UPI003445D1A9